MRTTFRAFAATFLAFALMFAQDAFATAANFTTTNSAVDGLGHCGNGGPDPDPVNCNMYDGKPYVWMNGGPVGEALGPGTYYFVILEPGGQADPNDDFSKVLSFADTVDPYPNRSFTINEDFSVTNLGTHESYGENIRLGIAPNWFEDTPNNGGEYDVGICRLVPGEGPNGFPWVQPEKKDCKFDNFKLQQNKVCPCGGEWGSCTVCSCQCGGVWPACNICECPCGGIPGACKECVTPTDPKFSVLKTALGSFDQKYSWLTSKVGCAPGTGPGTGKDCVTTIKGTGTVTSNYTVTVTRNGPLSQGYEAHGTITITLEGIGNDSGGNLIFPTVISIVDKIGPDPANGFLDINATCVIDGQVVGLNVVPFSLPATITDTTVLAYHCSYSPDSVASNPEINRVEVTTSNAVDINSSSNQGVSEATATFTLDDTIDECVSVKDAFNNGTPVAIGASSICATTSIPYSTTITVPTDVECRDFSNLATSTTNDTGTTSSGPATVTVCGFKNTGGLTMGFWQNKNGQDIIKTCAGAPQILPATPTSLQTFLTAYNPFKDAPATCSGLQTYVTNIIKAANASGAAMNVMLRAQMLATALDVYYSSPALGGNKIGAPAPLGGVSIDTTQVCKNIPTCSVYDDSSSVFGGSPKTVLQLLSYAGSAPQCALNAGSWCSGTAFPWYGQDKIKQEKAKNMFDAINNQKAFGG